MSDGAFTTTIVFPCLNERGSIGRCVQDARDAFDRAGLACEVIVADNGSTDGSPEIAAEAGARVVRVARRGYGSAISGGVAAASGDVILVLDADGTYPVTDGPLFAKAAWENDAIVLGSRFAGQIQSNAMPFLHRVVGSPATRLLTRVFFGVRGSDPHSGMRAMRRALFERVRPRSGGMEFAVEMIVNATRLGVPIQEIPIVYGARTGESKLRALPEGWALLRFLVLRSPTYLFVLPGLVVFAIGAAALAWLAPANRSIGPATLGLNSVVVAVLLATAGYQLVVLGLCARVYVAGSQADDTHNWARPFVRRFTLERGIGVGSVVTLVGVGLVAWIGAHWVSSHYSHLTRADNGLALIGLTFGVIGTETIFSSFFLALIASLIEPSA
jgi:hypothetical protein